MSFPRRLLVSLGVMAVLSGCMPLSDGQTSATTSATSSAGTLTATAPASSGAFDVGSFEGRVVSAARTVPTGTFVLVIRTSMVGGDLTLRYNGAYDVTDATTPRCRLDGTQNGQPLSMVVVGDKLYTKVGQSKYGLSSVSASVQQLGLVTVRPDLPTLVALLASSVRGVSDVGPDSVNGVAVERWRSLVDASVFAPSATGTTPVDVWVDDAGLVRQVSYSLTSGSSTTTIVTLTYGDFNSAVVIAEPDPSEVR